MSPVTAEPPLLWVQNGRASAEIVREPVERGTDPADELNGWLERICGVRLPVRERPSADVLHVFLGATAARRRLGQEFDAAAPGEQGYLVRRLGNDVVIAGGSPLGTLHGVNAFAEHNLGCRRFWPGESGRVTPTMTTIQVDPRDEISEPAFPIRWIIRDPVCARFNGGNVGLGEEGAFRIHWFVHTWTRLVPPETYFDAHPEYYADYGGQRKDPRQQEGGQVNLCTTNTEVVDAAVRTIDRLVKEHPDLNMVSVDPMDTQLFCQCENCRRWQDPHASYEARNSRLVFDFTNRVAARVAERHPGLLIKTIAYHTYLAPPPFRMRDNVVIQFCRFMCHNHPLDDPDCPESAYFNRYLTAWTKVCKRVMLYEYYYKASWCGLPWPIVHTLRRDLPYLHRLGVVGIASQWSRNAAANGLDFYIAHKLLWNPDVDVDALLADYYRKAYGAAATPMRRFHERLETTLAESGLHVAPQRSYRTIWRLLTHELLAELETDIAKARRLANDDGARQRIDLMARNLNYCRLVADYLTTVARCVEQEPPPRWMGMAHDCDLDQLTSRCQARVDAIRSFASAPANAESCSGVGPYVQLLLSPRQVAGQWFRESDRPDSDRLTKTEWCKRRGESQPPAPARVALWVYGNDIDWTVDNGPEHRVLAMDRQGKPVVIARLGRPDRQGDGRNLAFVVHGVDLTDLRLTPLHLVIDNPPGGPYASRIFAVYVMPDEAVDEDDVGRQLERSLETVRRRAFGFVELGFTGEYSREVHATELDIELTQP